MFWATWGALPGHSSLGQQDPPQPLLQEPQVPGPPAGPRPGLGLEQTADVTM